MRRDIVYYFNADVATVYNAYLAAAKGRPFDRSCKEEPFHTISFGLNFSMKYNFNGGSCTLHFMPYQTGCAVDLRFTIAQLTGARYGAYAKELTMLVERQLGMAAATCKINVEQFLRPENQVVPGQPRMAPPPMPLPTQPQRPIPPAPSGRLCPNCGCAAANDAAFCIKCGCALQAEAPAFCTHCGNKLEDGAVFCTRCGTKI